MTKTNVPRLRFRGFEEEWDTTKFGNLYKKNVEKNEINFDKSKTISISKMKFNKEGNGADYSSLKLYKVLRVGDIAFEGHKNKKFEFGRFVLNDIGDGIMSPRFTSLRPITNQYIPFMKYLVHLEKIIRPILVKSTKAGTMMNELVVSDLLKQNINIPSYKEQQKIGSFVAKIDKLIELQTQKLKQLKKLKQAYLQKTFPQEEESVPRLRFSGFSDKWNEVKIGKIMDVGSVFRIHQRDWRKEGVPFIRARDIVSYLKQGHFSNDRIFISEDKYKEMIEKSGNANKGDILVTGVGTIGIPFLIRTDEPLYFKDGNIIWLKNNNVVNPNFLFYNFLTPFVQDEIFSFSGVGTVATYTIESAKKTKLILPTNSEQQKIGAFFSNLDLMISNQSKKIETLKQQKKAYLQKMFI